MKWIDCKKELPDVGTWVLAYTRDQVHMLFLDDKDPASWLHIDGDWKEKVTHWMPLPDPPNKAIQPTAKAAPDRSVRRLK